MQIQISSGFHGGIRRDEKTSAVTLLNIMNSVPYIRCVSRCVETQISELSNAHR